MDLHRWIYTWIKKESLMVTTQWIYNGLDDKRDANADKFVANVVDLSFLTDWWWVELALARWLWHVKRTSLTNFIRCSNGDPKRPFLPVPVTGSPDLYKSMTSGSPTKPGRVYGRNIFYKRICILLYDSPYELWVEKQGLSPSRSQSGFSSGVCLFMGFF